jgi:hypothetical protein
MGTVQLAFVEDPCGGSRGSDHCACLTGSDVTGSHVTFFLTFPRIFPYFLSRTFFPYFFISHIFFSHFFPVLFFVFFIFPVLVSVLFPVLFYRIFSKVATFEIQRFKISVSCFSSTCRYSTVHVPCGISIQTSPVGLPLEGLGARMRDLKRSKMNLFNLKED